MISDLLKRKILYGKIYNKFDFLFNLGNLKADDVENNMQITFKVFIAMI